MLEWHKFSELRPRKNAKILVIEEGIIIECVYYGHNAQGYVVVERLDGFTLPDPEYWCKKPQLPKGVVNG